MKSHIQRKSYLGPLMQPHSPEAYHAHKVMLPVYAEVISCEEMVDELYSNSPQKMLEISEKTASEFDRLLSPDNSNLNYKIACLGMIDTINKGRTYFCPTDYDRLPCRSFFADLAVRSLIYQMVVPEVYLKGQELHRRYTRVWTPLQGAILYLEYPRWLRGSLARVSQDKNIGLGNPYTVPVNRLYPKCDLCDFVERAMKVYAYLEKKGQSLEFYESKRLELGDDDAIKEIIEGSTIIEWQLEGNESD